MTPGLPFPSEEKSSTDVDDGRPLGEGFAVHSVGTRPKKSASSTTRQVDALEARVVRLSSVCEAMWQLVSTELGLDLSRLSVKLQQMDPTGTALEDRGAAEIVCPNCGNNKPADEELCLFCSARAPRI